MSLESDFKQIRVHLSRIADALEALLRDRGYVPDSPTSVELDEDGEAKRTEKKDKPKSKKKEKKKKGKETKVGKDDDDDDDDVPTLKEVRAALKKLQEAVNQAAVKSLLKKYGASTLGQLKESKYKRVIEDALEDAE